VENEDRKLETKDNQTWAMVPPLYVTGLLITCVPRDLCVCRDVSPTSQMRVEIQMKRGNLSWPKKEQASKEIDLRKLYNDYWTSKAHELALQGKS